MKLFFLTTFGSALAAFLVARFLGEPPASISSGPTEATPTPIVLRIAAAPLTEAQALQAEGESLSKRQRILSIIGDAQTDAEVMGLLRDFAGDSAAEESLIAHWAARDPLACLKWVRDQRYDVNDPKFHLRQALFRTWAVTNPEEAWKAALQERTRPGFSDVAFQVIEAALQQSLMNGARFLAQLPDFSTLYFFPKNLWETDPASLVKAALPVGRTPDHSLVSALRAPLQAWSTKDPAAVQAWLESLPPGAAGPLMVNAAVGLAAYDPEAAAKLIDQIPSASLREAAAEQLVRGWAKDHPSEALLYAARQINLHRDVALTEVCDDLAIQGNTTIQSALSGLTDPKARHRLVPFLAQAWLNQDHPQAANWLCGLPPGPERTDALAAIANRWSENAPGSALRFLAKDADPTLDDLYQKSIFRAINNEPRESMPLILAQPAERILPGIRTAYNTLSTEYQMEDATALLKTLPKPEYQVEAVRSFMEPFASGMRLFDEGLAWAAALPPGPLRETARDTLLKSEQLTPKERARATAAFQ